MLSATEVDQIASLHQKYQVKQLELNALLEVTQAINADVSEASLYKIFQFTLRASLGLERMALYVREDAWLCKLSFGVKAAAVRSCAWTDQIEAMDRPHRVAAVAALADQTAFDYVVPVCIDRTVRAYVLLGTQADLPDDALSFVQALSNVLFVAVDNKRLMGYRLEQEALRREMDIARRVQQQLFPRSLPNQGFLTLQAAYQPHDSVGGDYYDCVELGPDQFLLCVADVSGKGIPAALLMANFQASLRTLVRQTTELPRVVTELNRQICQNSNGEKFITCFLALCDRRTRTLSYVNAGHNPPVLLYDDGTHALLDTGTTVLGVFDELPALETASEPLTSSLLFAYTDGIIETFNAAAEPYGLERLLEVLLATHRAPLAEVHAGVMASLDRFRGQEPFSDDLTMLSARICLP